MEEGCPPPELLHKLNDFYCSMTGKVEVNDSHLIQQLAVIEDR
jgi:hypothetical protein